MDVCHGDFGYVNRYHKKWSDKKSIPSRYGLNYIKQWETENTFWKDKLELYRLVYRIVSPFLRSSLCLQIWKRLTKKR